MTHFRFTVLPQLQSDMGEKKHKASAHVQRRDDGKLLVKLRPENRKFKALLSIDGGGVRGTIPAVVLQGFEQIVKEVFREVYSEYGDTADEDMVVDIRDYFDMVSGNSSGSILALYITSGGGNPELYQAKGALEGREPGTAASALVALEKFVDEVFVPRWHARIPGLRSLSGMLESRYNNSGLIRALEKMFGNLSMSSICSDVYIPAYELDNARPVGFYVRRLGNNESESGYMFPRDQSEDVDDQERENPGMSSKCGVHCSSHFDVRSLDVPIRVVAQASSSAPVFFNPAKYYDDNLPDIIDVPEKHVRWADGGVVSNNPTMQALSLMSTIYCNRKTKEMLSVKKMAVLSLGTGTKRQCLNIHERGGFVPWGADLISALMDAHTWMNHQIIDALFDGSLLKNMQDRYLRINRVAKEGSPDFHTIGTLDSKEKIRDLKKIGRELLTENRTKLKDFVKDILMAESSEREC